jgi:hypothetical protein
LSGGQRLAFVFASSWFDQSLLLQSVRSVLGQVPLIGGSTAGEISPSGAASHSCVVLLIASDGLVCQVGMADQIARAPREAGQRAAHAAVKGWQPGAARAGCIVFADGLVPHIVDVMRGMQEALGTGALIVGGMAGDDLRYQKTYQYANDQVLSGGVSCVLLGGDVALGVGLGHGFAPISKPRHVTRAASNVIVELDEHPAALVYEDYFGHRLITSMPHEVLTRQTIAYPLGIQCVDSSQWLLRNVVSFHEDGSLACNAEIPEGSWVQLMISSKELALTAAQHAAQRAIQSLKHVGAVLVFDCISRRKLLGEWHITREIEMIRQVVGPTVPLAGCYTYGEQGPSNDQSSAGRIGVQTGSVLVIAFGVS